MRKWILTVSAVLVVAGAYGTHISDIGRNGSHDVVLTADLVAQEISATTTTLSGTLLAYPIHNPPAGYQVNRNLRLGYQAAPSASISTSWSNVVIGHYAGYTLNGGDNSTIVGSNAAYFLSSGISNTFIGNLAGYKISTGGSNTGLGVGAGYNNEGGGYNCWFGEKAGGTCVSESVGNVAIGYEAGNTANDYNVFLGYQAGKNETGSNKLYIDNSDTTTPLIYGDFGTNAIKINGSLEVDGSIVGGLQMPTEAWDEGFLAFELLHEGLSTNETLTTGSVTWGANATLIFRLPVPTSALGRSITLDSIDLAWDCDGGDYIDAVYVMKAGHGTGGVHTAVSSYTDNLTDSNSGEVLEEGPLALLDGWKYYIKMYTVFDNGGVEGVGTFRLKWKTTPN